MHVNVCMLWIILAPTVTTAWIVRQAKQNVWVTLAKSITQDNFALSMGSVEDLLSTCLVDIPLTARDCPFAGKKPKPVDGWDEWSKGLPWARASLGSGVV